MKRSRKIGISIVVLIMVGSVGSYVFLKKENKPTVNNSLSRNLDDQLKKACSFLNEEKAKTVLGERVTQTNLLDGGASSSSESIAVSQCSYFDSNTENSKPAEVIKLSVVIRSPRDETGKTSNATVFETSGLPARSEVVAGFGDKAFWNDEFAQLNVLKDDDWYILEYGPDIPQSRSLEDTKRAAEVLF